MSPRPCVSSMVTRNNIIYNFYHHLPPPPPPPPSRHPTIFSCTAGRLSAVPVPLPPPRNILSLLLRPVYTTPHNTAVDNNIILQHYGDRLNFQSGHTRPCHRYGSGVDDFGLSFSYGISYFYIIRTMSANIFRPTRRQ